MSSTKSPARRRPALRRPSSRSAAAHLAKQPIDALEFVTPLGQLITKWPKHRVEWIFASRAQVQQQYEAIEAMRVLAFVCKDVLVDFLRAHEVRRTFFNVVPIRSAAR